MNKPLIVSARDYGWPGLELLETTIHDQADRLAVVEGRLNGIETAIGHGAQYWALVRRYVLPAIEWDDDAATALGYLDTMFDWTPESGGK